MVSSLKLLREHGLAPKKSFGQNFLQDTGMCQRIAELAAPERVGTIVEIGAGLGALTEPLAGRCDRLIAIERDRDLVPILSERFRDDGHVEIVEADAVRADWSALLASGEPARVVAGNLPYQITGRLLRRVVEQAPQLARSVLMVQREVADRMVAAPSTAAYGALSVFVQAAFLVERALTVSPGAFAPQPRVGSAVVVLRPERKAEESDLFRALVQKAFGARRKKLSNAWRTLAEPDMLREAAAAAHIDLDARGETLSVAEFAAMEDALKRA